MMLPEGLRYAKILGLPSSSSRDSLLEGKIAS